ncbi:hypothetical protein CTAYLR_001942 [Chrysophaeum taylorii]|uniref:ABC transporter domain-containing protein n=1 Tax=Chrysophaeum taylorii TaxID=2483200 RepID=A0AAD7XGB0_9STRA|nr:hypothetical protein CTAYLR_001942 [Chrysophaeum taylorii]
MWVWWLLVGSAFAECDFRREAGDVLGSEYDEEKSWGGFSAPECAELRCNSETQALWLLRRSESLSVSRDDTMKVHIITERSYCMMLLVDGKYARFGRGEARERNERFGFGEKVYDDWEDVDWEANNTVGLENYEDCLSYCDTTCEELSARDDEETFEALYASIAVDPNDAPSVCFADRGNKNLRYFTDAFWVYTVFGALLLFVPCTLACCASLPCCFLYPQLMRLRNMFDELFPRLARALGFCCSQPTALLLGCGRCECCRECCAFCGPTRRAEAQVAQDGEPPPPEAVVTAQPSSVEMSEIGGVIDKQQQQQQQQQQGPPKATKPASLWTQFKLLMWQIFTMKMRDSSAIMKQVFYPALFFTALWLLYVVMGVTGFGNRWNKQNANWDRKDGDTRDYERGQILSYGLLEAFCSQIAFVFVMQHVIVGLVVEHHAKLLEAARMAGLRDASYWVAHFVADGVIVGFVAAFLIAVVATGFGAGGLFRFAGFADSPFGMLLALHWVYLVALVAFCFAATVLIPSALIASLFSVLVQIAALVLYWLCAPDNNGKLGSIFEVSPVVQRWWAVVPQFAYATIITSFLSNRERFCRIAASIPGTNETFSGDKYACSWDDDDEYELDYDDAKRKYRDALSDWLDSNDAECGSDGTAAAYSYSYATGGVLADCSVVGPWSEYPSFFDDSRPRDAWTASLFGMLLLDIVIYLVLAWYLNQIVPWSEYGTPKPWYFIFLPSFWCECFGLKSGDDDVATSTNNDQDSTRDVVDAGDDRVEPRTHLEDVVVTVSHLHKTFGRDFKAVNGVAFDVARSEIFCLLGHNGAGKTTTIACLTGLLTPDRRGETAANVFGQNIFTADGMRHLRATLGVCPQHDILYPLLTLKEHIMFFSRLKGKSIPAASRDADNLLQVFHLADRAAHLGNELSGGQKRKLSTSIALAGSSRFIVLDEPTAGMDPVARRELWTLLRSVRKDRAMLLTTHHMDEAEVLGDRIAVMVAGRVAANGSVQYLKHKFSPFLIETAAATTTTTKDSTAAAAAYRLEVDLGPEGDARDVDALVLSSPGSSLVAARATSSKSDETSSSAAVLYNIMLSSDADLKRLSEICRALDGADALAISRYAILTTTLEDVFLQVGKSAEIHNVAKEDHGEAAVTVLKQRSSRQLSRVGKDLEAAGGEQEEAAAAAAKKTFGAVASQTAAIFALRANLSARSIRALATIFVPAIVAVLITALAKDGVIDSKNSWSELSNVIVALLVVGSYVVVPGLVALPLVQERALRLRNLLTISGCDARAFWIGTLASDVSLVLASVAVTLVAIAASGMAYRVRDDEYAVVYAENTTVPIDLVRSKEYDRRLWATDVGWIWVLMPMFAFSLVALSHLVSFGFAEPMACAGAFPVINLVGFILGPMMFVMCFFLIFGGGFESTDAIQIVNWNFQEVIGAFGWLAATISPIGNLLVFLFRVTNLNFLPRNQQDQKADPTWPYYWACLLLLVLQLVVFEGLAYLKDRIETRPLRFVKSKFSKKRREKLDPDVRKERDRVLALVEGNAETTTTLLEDDVAGDAPDEPLLRGGVDGRARGCFGRCVTPVLEFLDDARIALENKLPSSDRPPDFKPGIAEEETPGLAVVELRKIFPPKRYGALAVEAVQNVTFGVSPGECFGLLGSNGAGKTTTMSMAARQLEPTSGDAKVVGVSTLTNFARASVNLSVVNQMNTLWESLSCLNHVVLFARLRMSARDDDAVTTTTKEAIDELARATLAAVELDKHALKLAGRLSGGMKRKLCCATALVADPKVVMLDEPSAGLDPVSQRNLWNLIQATMKGRSVVLTTHSMLEADVLCDRIAIMTYGQIKCLGTPSHLKARYTSGYDLVLKLDDSYFARRNVSHDASEEDEDNKAERPARSFEEAKLRVDDFIDRAFSDHDSKPRLVGADAGTLTYELGSGGEKARLDGLLARAFETFDAATRAALGVAEFVVNPASMEKVFLNIVAESEDAKEKQLQAAQLGRRVASQLEDDDDDDDRDEDALDVHNVKFSEPTKCGCSQWAHRMLLRWHCALCCGCCLYSAFGIFGALPWFFTGLYVCFLSFVSCGTNIVCINMCFQKDNET